MRRSLSLVLLLAVGLCLFTAPAFAENMGPGGGTRVIVGDQVVGPYQLWVTTSPEPAQVGKLTVAVRITDPSTGKRITENTTINIELTSPDDGSKITAEATHFDAGNSVDYAAHIQVPSAGSWNGKMRIDGPAGEANVDFTARVLSPRTSSTLVMLGLPFLVVLAVLGGIWYWRSSSRAAKEPAY